MRAAHATRMAGLILLTGAVLASGCSSGDDGAEPDGTTTTTEATSEPVDDGTTTTAPVDDGDAEDPTAGGDGCDLISDDVASAVLGIEIERREPHEDEASKGVSCIKGTERQADVTTASYVSVARYPAAGGAVLIEQATAEGATSVDGLGDEAVFLASAGLLLVLDGDDTVQVQVVKDGVPSGIDDATTVAGDVLDHLA